MCDYVRELTKTHKLERGTSRETSEEYFNIYIRKPEDFVYDMSDIIVRYFPKTGTKTVICEEIPEKIKKNILKFEFLEIRKFIELFEENLNVFLKGKVPEIEIKGESEETLAEGELSQHFKFPVCDPVTTNLKCDNSTHNVIKLCCMQLNLVVECSRCEEVNNILGNTLCKRCATEIGYLYIPVLMYDSFGFLEGKKCEILGFNPMRYQLKCLGCERMYETPELEIGKVYTRNCIECHASIMVKINSINLYRKTDVKFKEGQELPNKGTCKHYKKSFRWFRFKCCNSLYPCDKCHDEKSGHTAELANKMVCGLCSKEQTVRPECDCGMNLKKKRSQFWEGGKGNRDKVTMSKKESKKYR